MKTKDNLFYFIFFLERSVIFSFEILWEKKTHPIWDVSFKKVHINISCITIFHSIYSFQSQKGLNNDFSYFSNSHKTYLGSAKRYKRLKNIWKSNIIVETDEKQKSHNWNILWLRIKEAKDFVVRHQSDHQWRCCVQLLMRISKRIRQIPYGMKFLNLKKHMKFLRTILSSSFQIHVSI